MVGPSSYHPKALSYSSSHHISPMKTQAPSLSSSSTLTTSMKLKTLLQTFVFSHLYRIARAVTKAKSLLLQFFKDNIHLHNFLEFPSSKKSTKHKNHKLFFGSFRLHYNWSSSKSSHVLPMPPGHVYYDGSWDSIFSAELDDVGGRARGLSGYLEWLEEKGCGDWKESEVDDIDKLADMFIANCHENFRLEKQESYRRFQEMMARSV